MPSPIRNIFFSEATAAILQLAKKKIIADLLAGSSLEIGIRLILLVATLGNALLFAFLLPFAGVDLAEEPAFLTGLSLFIIVLSIIIDFVPAQRSVYLYQAAHHPLTWFNRMGLWLVMNELHFANYLYFAGLFVFCFSPAVGPWAGMSLLLAFFVGQLFSFFLRLPVSYQVKLPKPIHLIGSLSAVSVLGTLLWLVAENIVGVRSICGIMVLTFSLLLLSQAYFFSFSGSHVKAKAEKFYSFSALTRNWNLRFPAKLATSLLFGFSFKTVFLILNLLYLADRNEYLFQSEFLFSFFISPIVIFTYGFNNFFAFDPNFFYNIHLRTADKFTFFSSYFQRLSPFLFLDLLLTTFLLLTFGQMGEFAHFALFYIAAACGLTGLGLWGSSRFPIRVKTSGMLTSLRTYTHPLVSVLSIGLVSVFYYFIQGFTVTILLTSVVLGLLFLYFGKVFLEQKTHTIISSITS